MALVVWVLNMKLVWIMYEGVHGCCIFNAAEVLNAQSRARAKGKEQCLWPSLIKGSWFCAFRRV